MPNPPHRPTIYTEELAKTICQRIANGESVRSIARDDSMPAASTIFDWALNNPIFSEHYVRAKEIGAEIEFEELQDMADSAKTSIVGDDKSDNARVQAVKLSVDTKKWALSKKLPKKYGDKLDLTSDNKPIPLLYALRDNDSNKENSRPTEKN